MMFVNSSYCGNHCAIYMYIKPSSLYLNIKRYVNYISKSWGEGEEKQILGESLTLPRTVGHILIPVPTYVETIKDRHIH